jgi:hypothetical protein
MPVSNSISVVITPAAFVVKDPPVFVIIGAPIALFGQD